MTLWLAIGAFVLCLLIGVPIAYSLGTASVVYLVLKGVSLGLIAQRLFTGLDSFAFMAIHFFILAGAGLRRQHRDLVARSPAGGEPVGEREDLERAGDV